MRNTSFIGAKTTALGSATDITTIGLQASLLAPLPSGETIQVDARLGGVVQGSASFTTAAEGYNPLQIVLNGLAFDELYIYGLGDFASIFIIDNLVVDVTSNVPPIPPLPTCGDWLGSQVGASACIAGGALTLDAPEQMITGTLDVGAAGGTVDSNSFNGTLAGVIFGDGGLTKIGLGNVTLTAENTYLGGTIINEGMLTVNGSLASGVTVYPNGTLRGTGTISGPGKVFGRLAPGASPGTLTFTGDVTMTSGGTLQIDVDGSGTGNGAGNYSRVMVQGAGNSFTAAGTIEPKLRGITGDASNSFTPVIGQTFTIVQADGGVAGNFGALTQPTDGLPAGTRFDALYDPNEILLAVTPASYSSLPNVALAGNASRVGAALDGARPAAYAPKSSLFESLATLSESQLAFTLQQLSGEIHADMVAAGFNTHRLNRQTTFGRLTDLRLGRATPSLGGAGTPADAGFAGSAAARADRWVWIQGTGARVDTDEDRNAHDFSESLYGIVGGVDMPVNKDLQLGLAVGYAHNDVDSGFIGKGDTDTWQLIGYGLWTQGQYFANFTLGYGWDNYTTRRQVELAPTTSLHSDTDGHSGFFDLEGGIRNAWNVYVIEPTAGIRGDTLRRDGFTENGEGGLRVKSQSYDALQTRLGAKVNRTVELADGKRVTPEFRAYWLHDFGDSVATESDALLLGQQFTARSPDAGRDALALGLGVTVDAGRDVALFLDYGFTYRDAQTGQGLIGGLSVKW